MSDEPDFIDEEFYDDWACRVYTDAADTHGYAVGFMIFCLANHPKILAEFNEYDRQMRATGLFVKVIEGDEE